MSSQSPTGFPWWSRLPGSKRVVRDYALARSTLYFLEGIPLLLLNRALTNRWSKENRPPTEFTRAVIEAGRELLEKDSARAVEGLFPLSLLKPQAPLRHFRSLIGVLRDGVKVAWRMSRNHHQDFNQTIAKELEKLPDYYQRNFHFQSDGYLSESSAARYEHQVEILFKGAAGAMRRLALVPLVSRYKNTGSRLLELGAGSGSATKMVAAALPGSHLTALDLSSDYLKFARQELTKFRNVDFVQGDAADLNFKDQSFDGAYSIFLFHELPKTTRLEVMKEAYRTLRPGGQLVIVDSIQWDDTPELNWGLDQFPRDFHEPFYKNYLQTPLADQLEQAGFRIVHNELGLLAKCVVGEKPL